MTDTDTANAREPPTPTSLRVHILVMALVILPCIVVSQFIAHWQVGVLDDHLFAYGGRRILDGATLYADIWDNKPPGIYWTSALGLVLGGGRYGGIILLCTLASVLTFALFFIVAANVYRRGSAAIATILAGFYLTHGLLFAGGNRSETFLIPCELALVGLYLYGRRRRAWWCWYAAGLCGGVALLFKQTGFAALAAVILHVVILALVRELSWREAWRRAGLLVGGAATVVSLTAVFLATQGTIDEATFAVFTFNRWYVTQQERHWLEWWWWARRFDREIFAALRLPLFMAVAAGVHALLWRLQPTGGTPVPQEPVPQEPVPQEPVPQEPVPQEQRTARPPEIARTYCGTGVPPVSSLGPAAGTCPHYMTLFGVWFVIAAAAAVAGPHNSGHYILPVLPPMLLMGGHLIAILKAECGLVRRLAQRAWVLVAFLAVAYFAFDAIYLQFQQASQVWWDRRPRMDDGRLTVDQTVWESLGDEIARITHPGDTIQCWPYVPGIYLQARRPNACRFTTAGVSRMVGPHGTAIEREFRDSLQTDPPKIIVISADEYRELVRADTPMQGGADPLGRWLAADYRRVEELTRGNLYVLIRETPSPPP